ncbi:hypothetical protein [Mycolicibacter kumamotonensis]|uniref:Uncharacterized protein n=1 Tax=Mycolicibacter kumamotonensis TaxID=354243 RepID=A0A1B8SL95_9MYCO|nr:hypothetical protein [Mycolicibacter kumamotonensis]OBY33509.1 hypothetical protein ACT18_00770 [Mycolicibacter kumamotonensis]
MPLRDDDWWDGKLPWYNRYRDTMTKRWRVTYGDLASCCESESGSHQGPQFCIDMSFGDLTGQFDGWFEGHSTSQPLYDDHSFYIVIWRWGISVSVRGRQLREPYNTKDSA